MNMYPTTIQRFGKSAASLHLPEGFDIPLAINQLLNLQVESLADSRVAAEKREAERAKEVGASGLAERYNITANYVRRLTRRGILKASRMEGEKSYRYNVGSSDDAINQIRRADGSVKGSRADAGRPRARKSQRAA